MTADLLNAIIVIKFGLIRKGKCCMSYKLPDSVVKAMGTSQAYKSSTETSCSTVESTPSSTTTIEMRSEEEDDGHFNSWLKVFFMNIQGRPKVEFQLSATV